LQTAKVQAHEQQKYELTNDNICIYKNSQTAKSMSSRKAKSMKKVQAYERRCTKMYNLIYNL